MSLLISRVMPTNLALVLAIAAGALALGVGHAVAATSDYLYVWTGAEQEGDSDFLAVLDANPESGRYGEVLATLPVGPRGGAHHSEHLMPQDGRLFVNAFNAGRSYILDLNDPLQPRLAASFTNAGDYTYPHTFERLPGGNVLATFQTKGEGNTITGGLVELDNQGRVLRTSDAANGIDPDLRVYSVTPLPDLDLAVSTSSDMNLELEGRSFQLWRLSDLSLLQTIPLAPGEQGYEHMDPAEVRRLDSGAVIMTTFSCAMYRLTGLDSRTPAAELIKVMPWTSYDTDECGMPVTRGRFWVQTYANSAGSALLVLDMADPARPLEVERFELPGLDWWPHWLAPEPGGNRLALSSNSGATQYQVIMLIMDPDSGQLRIDRNFGDPDAPLPGVSFERTDWPHGAAGPGRPHGMVFSRPD